MSTEKKGPNLHVVPSQTQPGKFVVKEAGNPTPVTRPSSQGRAVEKAIPMAKQNHSEVVIHRPPCLPSREVLPKAVGNCRASARAPVRPSEA